MKLKVEKYSKNYYINQAMAKEIKENKILFIPIGNTNNLSGYILLKIDDEVVALNKERSKKYKDIDINTSHYVKVAFVGLRQQVKKIHIDTYRILGSFINGFDVNSIDICFDGYSGVAIHQSNINKLHWLFSDYFVNTNDTHIEKTSFYINKLVAQLDDADQYIKMILYDKYIKETRYKILNDSFKDWKRLEVRIPLNARLKDVVFDDYCLDVLTMASKYFNIDDFSLNYFYLQLELLTDGRTHKRYKKFIDEI